MAVPKRQRKRPPARPSGRPNQGIHAGYIRTELFLSPAMRADLDRLVDREIQRTGKMVTRTDLIRQAIEVYLRERLPEAKL